MVSIASRSVPGRVYAVENGRCACAGFTYRGACRHLLAAAELAEHRLRSGSQLRQPKEKHVIEPVLSEPERIPAPRGHRNVHEAIAAIYNEVDRVRRGGQVQGFGTSYRYAGEADIIAVVRPAMVQHQVIAYPLAVKEVARDVFTPVAGRPQNHVSFTLVTRFVHAPSGTSIDVETRGEGMDPGDKSSPKSATGAYKYALRQTFCLETGDDPDDPPPPADGDGSKTKGRAGEPLRAPGREESGEPANERPTPSTAAGECAIAGARQALAHESRSDGPNAPARPAVFGNPTPLREVTRPAPVPVLRRDAAAVRAPETAEPADPPLPGRARNRARPAWQSDLLDALRDASDGPEPLTMNSLRTELGVERVTGANYAALVDAWLAAHPASTVHDLVRLARSR